jgi:hypothetical protein
MIEISRACLSGGFFISFSAKRAQIFREITSTDDAKGAAERAMLKVPRIYSM